MYCSTVLLPSTDICSLNIVRDHLRMYVNTRYYCVIISLTASCLLLTVSDRYVYYLYCKCSNALPTVSLHDYTV